MCQAAFSPVSRSLHHPGTDEQSQAREATKLHTFKNYKMQGRQDVSVGKGAVTPDDLRLSRGPTEWKGAPDFRPSSSHPHVSWRMDALPPT